MMASGTAFIIPEKGAAAPDRAARLAAATARRRAAFVAAGREAFFTRGYAGTAMSTVAAKVGGSKTTLWQLFPSKQDLFVAVLDDLFERYGHALAIGFTPGEPVEPALHRFVGALIDTLLTEPAIALQRLVIGEAGRFPELARLFYERAPGPGQARLAAFMADAMARGALRPGDPAIAARHLSALCHHGSAYRCLLGLADPPATEARASETAAVIKAFLDGWRPDNT